MPGNREQQNARQELSKPNVSKIKRPFGNFVDLPAHRDGLHLDRGHNEEARNLKQHKSRMGKGGASRPGIGARRHELLM